MCVNFWIKCEFKYRVTIQKMRHFIFWKVMESRWLGSQTTQWVARFLLWCSLCGRREKMKLEKTSHANSALLHLVFYAKCKVFQVFQSLIDLFFNAPKTCQGFYVYIAQHLATTKSIKSKAKKTIYFYFLTTFCVLHKSTPQNSHENESFITNQKVLSLLRILGFLTYLEQRFCKIS